MHAHRDVEARKFKTRIDYVDLSAFGVNVEIDDADYHMEDSRKIEEAIKKYSNPYYKVSEALESLDTSLTRIIYNLCALARRYDEKLDLLINEELLVDRYQRELFMKHFQPEEYKKMMKENQQQQTVVEYQEVSKSSSDSEVQSMHQKENISYVVIRENEEPIKQQVQTKLQMNRNKSQIRRDSFALNISNLKTPK